MSIAVSAIVRPSRYLSGLLALMCVLAIAIALVTLLGQLGELTQSSRLFVFTVLLFLSFFGFYHGIRHRKTIHIDISGAGQIRIADAGEIRSCTSPNRPHVRPDGEVHRLLDNSTIWPCLLLLRLRGQAGAVVTLPILSDSVPADSFRALSVACRWIAAHRDDRESETPTIS
jgi:toxin CptA